jgi:hypothetical protein
MKELIHFPDAEGQLSVAADSVDSNPFSDFCLCFYFFAGEEGAQAGIGCLCLQLSLALGGVEGVEGLSCLFWRNLHRIIMIVVNHRCQ